MPVSTAVSPWQEELRCAIRDAATLCDRLNIAPPTAGQGQRQFPVFVTESYLARMRPGDPDDPLLRQVFPDLREDASQPPRYGRDPTGDLAARRLPGVLQKYAGRALLITTGSCGIHCRYCFRRHYPYSESPRTLPQWEPALKQIAASPSISEVLLSGGDPWMLVDRRLEELITALESIPQLRRLRVHTRMPIVVPQRVTDGLLAPLRSSRLACYIVVHANHARELNGEVAGALAKIRAADLPLLNQAVLLRGVNDTYAAQRELCERLLDLRVLPYYLHQLDPVSGAAHFETPPELGPQLIAALRASLPGYGVPRLVREDPGATSKTLLA